MGLRHHLHHPVGNAQNVISGSIRKVQPLFQHALMALLALLSRPLGTTDPFRMKQILRIRKVLTTSVFCQRVRRDASSLQASITVAWIVASKVWLPQKLVGMHRCWWVSHSARWTMTRWRGRKGGLNCSGGHPCGGKCTF